LRPVKWGAATAGGVHGIEYGRAAHFLQGPAPRSAAAGRAEGVGRRRPGLAGNEPPCASRASPMVGGSPRVSCVTVRCGWTRGPRAEPERSLPRGWRAGWRNL